MTWCVWDDVGLLICVNNLLRIIRMFFFSVLLFCMKDGFFDGELLDGRRGLVPSNFVQKLVGEDLLEFHQAVVQGLRDGDDSASTNIAHDLAQEAVALMG